MERLSKIAAKAAREQFEVETLRSRPVHMRDDAPERKRQFLDGTDAHGLYRTLHREDVLILAFTAVFVRRDPSRDPGTRKKAIPLEAFVEHKAAYGLVRNDRDIPSHLDLFESVRQEPPACSGFDDPRVLPFHVFEATEALAGLGSAESNKAFRDRYGPPAERVDEGRKHWLRASDLHGRDALVVARHALEAGRHWDVITDKRSAHLYTSHQVWQLSGKPRDYLNVYPDAHVRLTSRSGCRLVWPRQEQRRRR